MYTLILRLYKQWLKLKRWWHITTKNYIAASDCDYELAIIDWYLERCRSR